MVSWLVYSTLVVIMYVMICDGAVLPNYSPAKIMYMRGFGDTGECIINDNDITITVPEDMGKDIIQDLSSQQTICCCPCWSNDAAPVTLGFVQCFVFPTNAPNKHRPSKCPNLDSKTAEQQ